MGIKDIFRLEGTQLTMMSRTWTEIYGPDEESADYTKKLIELGAVIVRKTKMTSFASPEEPTDQWVEFHCPVNPRGDHYQSPSSSSTGAGTSLLVMTGLISPLPETGWPPPSLYLSPYANSSATQLPEVYEHPHLAADSSLCDPASSLHR
jgi:hypothetical protein